MAATADRLDLLEKAATLMQRGELAAALPEYVRLFQRHPEDWNIANTLGDLYARVGKTDEAVAHFSALAEKLAADGFTSKARAIYRKVLRLRPDNEIAQYRIQEFEKKGVGVSPFLQRVLQTARAAREAHAQDATPPTEALSTPAAVEPPQVQAVPVQPPLASPASTPPPQEVVVDIPLVVEVQVTPPRAAAPPKPSADEWETIAFNEPEPAPEPDDQSAFLDAEALVSAALARNDFASAAAVLQTFLGTRPQHIAALEALVDIAVDGSLPIVANVQSQLAEACRAAGLTERADAIVADLEWRTGFVPIDEAPPAAAAAEPGTASSSVADVLEVAPAATAATPQSVNDPAIDSLGDDIGVVGTFDDLRNSWLHDLAAAAEAKFSESERLIAASKRDAAVAALEEAMCLPQLRVRAGARLAHLHRSSGSPIEALACLEWVAQMPPATEDDGHELAYELALTLEALDQQAQALGVYRELLAEVGPTYRDVARRAERLAAA